MWRAQAISAFAGIILMGAVAMPAVGDSDQVTSVRAYFVGWNVSTRSRLSAKDVVEMKRIVIEINDAGLARNFVEWLHIDELRERPQSEPADARLTIEIDRLDGSQEVYYADMRNLYSGDSLRSRPVDAEFRSRFDIARNP